jgi:hypothetical protein
MFGDDEEVVIFQRCLEKEGGSESTTDVKTASTDSLEVENIASGK